ncbi:hypothetical protein ABZX69_35830 [Streptomyces sp. NPDC004074]|uniref:hypothetical protein n=1 Tax=Streptomyces sp. NPDC004074 TaxID=3154277 RepID=UPI0033B191BE
MRTVESATDNPATMITSLAMDDGTAFPARACQLVDAARIASAKATATQAAVQAPPGSPTGPTPTTWTGAGP